ncbi:EVE domain protein [Niveomyces insectorum RCEF 264]|uniref:EVE domain protein n=1 Tax=Niveomyces insectorum RCEF 264 TaxID=1081102 RepID=A0A162MQQ2_9HYPO|nr:EVE domain protein [Niveomyces insectorum RCEF 264]
MAKRKRAEVNAPGTADGQPLRRSSRQNGTRSTQKDARDAQDTAPAGDAGKPQAPKRGKKDGPSDNGANETSDTKKGRKEPNADAGKKMAAKTASTAGEGGRQYWLLKAEPESRFENGVDVKFSIDDLAAKTEPEPWDGKQTSSRLLLSSLCKQGITTLLNVFSSWLMPLNRGNPRLAARNNLRAMKKGDLAFFYHSNCKEPGIVGTMEIVQEHSPDLSAHDTKAPYYDPSSKPSDPKWSVVHVVFHSKFKRPITLKELRERGASGKPLENMQMLRQTRLSVSKVSPAEWEYLLHVAEET